MIRNLLIRLAGHHPAGLEGERREDGQQLHHLGWAVCLGAVVAGINWAIAGFVFAGGHWAIDAAVVGIFAGAIGAALVVVIDRAGLFHIDTHKGSRFSAAPLVLFRVAITCLVSSVTTQAVAPKFLEAELRQHALQLQEVSDETRAKKLADRYNITAVQSTKDEAEAGVLSAREAAKVVPPSIQEKFAHARKCWASYQHLRILLQNQSETDSGGPRRLASLRTRCGAEQASAQQLLEEYQREKRDALASAEDKYQLAAGQLAETVATIKSRQVTAAEIERSAITPLSAVVLQSLLATDPGARRKYWTIYALLLCLELMPLIVKLMGPQSVLGSRLGTNRLVALAYDRRRLHAATDEIQIHDALRSAMSQAMLAALAGSDIRDTAARIFREKAAALVPLEVFKALMREIEAHELDVQAAISRHPQYARVISDLWRQTVDDVVATLKRAQPHMRAAA